MDFCEVYGMALRRLRQERGLTQGELGALCGLSASGIGMLERGQRLPSAKAQERLRRCLPQLPSPPPKPLPCAELLTVLRREELTA